MPSIFSSRLARWIASAACLSGLIVPGNAFADAGGGDQWKRYRDPASGATVSYPSGWSVERHGYTLLVRSQDKASLAMIEAFQHGEGETAQGYLGRFAGNQAKLFPQAKVEQIQPQPSQSGDEAVARVGYHSANGKPGLARALCRVTPGVGFLYVMAAPADRLDKQAHTLYQILKSFAFESGPPASAGQASSANMKYMNWVDPREKSFSVDVPVGWKVEGGNYQVGMIEYRPMVQATSPDGQVAIIFGDTNLCGFREPDSLSAQLHQPEGFKTNPTGAEIQVMIFHYLPAQQFNEIYLKTSLSSYFANIAITNQQDLPDLASREVARAQALSDRRSPALQFTLQDQGTAARTSFTANSQDTGKPVAGFLESLTMVATITPKAGISVQVPRTWNAVTRVCVYPPDLNSQDRELCVSIVDHMTSSWTPNQQWQDAFFSRALELQRQHFEQTRQILDQQFAAAAQRSAQFWKNARENTIRSGEAARAQIRQSGEATRARIQAGWESRQAQTERICDWVLDRQKMVNPETGQVTKVDAANYHYQVGQNIVNSNVPLNFPDVNSWPVLLQNAPYTPHN